MRMGSKLPSRRYGIMVREGVVKISPNEPCPCGSTVKFKKCCDAASGISGWWRRRRAVQAKIRQLNEQARNG